MGKQSLAGEEGRHRLPTLRILPTEFVAEQAGGRLQHRQGMLLLGGIGRLQKSDPERVDVKKLRIRACGGLVAGALYLACRYLQL